MINNPQEQTINVDMLDLMKDQYKIFVLKIGSGMHDQVDIVANNLREDDYREVWRSSGRCPRKTIQRSWLLEGSRWIIFFNGGPVALFGAVHGDNKTGFPWMVATDKFHHKDMERYFIKNCYKYIKDMFFAGDYLQLLNCVDVDNKKAIKWLEWCGFRMEEVIKYGPFKMDFFRFSMARSIN